MSKLQVFIGIIVINILGALLLGVLYTQPMTIEEFSICMHYNPELTTLEELQDKCK